MIQLTEVSKSFQKKLAVDRLSFSVGKGEVFGFLGPNGAGKTTTLRMMTGLLQPTNGEILINGMNISLHKKNLHAQIGVVFELPNLYARSSVRDNLILFADLYGVTSNRVIEVMDSLQLLERQRVRVDSLSKGWKQRVLIARALLHKPKVLFLDEPTSGLDPNSAALIREYIKIIKTEGTTIVLTTHDMHEAEELSDRVGIMHAGRMVALDNPQSLKNDYGKAEIETEYWQDGEIIKTSWPLADEATKDHIYQLMTSGQMISLHSKEASLADVFAVLTGSELS
ncbi:ABC transporter ATP-binding protein [Paenibacillus monticola]|uniref:ATP-binding cassette domain-containing protein n=1 Tax=Paenibacillus monticola TaxID=2666075 RepID=A0A7X2L3L7_9BACL|nr:ABC transporter ATP-binding protein [Paenibacillus monticola]MRN54456.1 ATP-binding cassette domain-containing protein [Paenibacillus monticola]